MGLLHSGVRYGSFFAFFAMLVACKPATSQSDQPLSPIQQRHAQVIAMQQLGAKLFNDPALSGSGKLACSNCHQPQLAFSAPLAVMPGGAALAQLGNRAVPGLTYLQNVPQFSQHFFEDDGDDSIDNGPTGGLDWDGRVDQAHQQVSIPLFASNEMAASKTNVVAAAQQYQTELQQLFGKTILTSTDRTIDAISRSLAAYLHSPVFYPYSSKFDAVTAGNATFTQQEARGLALFNDPKKGNCASCHVSHPDANGGPAKFSDYGMIALAVPRNPAIPANRDTDYFDLGLCGPYRQDFVHKADYCGRFRAPSLRNVALKKHFFHNGVFNNLHDVIAFYASRDTNPARWYPSNADGTVDKYNDLPKQYWGNINMDPPFGGKPGDKPVLTEQDIDDIEAFLTTLTDGYQPNRSKVN